MRQSTSILIYKKRGIHSRRHRQKADIRYLDRVGLELVKQISQGVSIEEAVSKTMEKIGPDPTTGAKLLYVKRS
ncbi:hypothetical protein J7L00_01805 [Candidatus Bathyarchaeota archaeon]|nr:hypothetical protein [Candidatus Bathyarchaeota archaeon]